MLEVVLFGINVIGIWERFAETRGRPDNNAAVASFLKEIPPLLRLKVFLIYIGPEIF
jgi:hypothetical protein